MIQMQGCLQRLRRAKQWLREWAERDNVFEENEQKAFSAEEITSAVRFAAGSNAADYRHLGEVEERLRAVTAWAVRGEHMEEAEEAVALEEESFWSTPKYVLYMLQKYLERVMPTNITYYHFLREKEFYALFVAIRYVLVLGLHPTSPLHFLHKIKTKQRTYVFLLLLEWLLALVYYRCSAIYIASNCVDPLIFEAHLLLSALLGYGGHSVLSTLGEAPVGEVVNKLLYIQGFLLAMAVPVRNHLAIEATLTTLRKLLTSVPPQPINMYLPSYLFARLIGYVKTPFTTDIILRLLIHYLTKSTRNQGRESAQVIEVEDFPRAHITTQCWSLIALLAQEYPPRDKSIVRDLLLARMESVDNRSMDRAFLLRVGSALKLDSEDARVEEWARRHAQPYVVSGKVVTPEVMAKNYHIAMEEHYLPTIAQAAQGRWHKVEASALWVALTAYNRFQIPSIDDYLAQLPRQ